MKNLISRNVTTWKWDEKNTEMKNMTKCPNTSNVSQSVTSLIMTLNVSVGTF